jgi:DnaJ-class molecular chaperone
MIELIPVASDSFGAAERAIVRDILCPKCAGSGRVMEYGIKDEREISCSRCAGTGRLRARVAIEWEADV